MSAQARGRGNEDGGTRKTHLTSVVSPKSSEYGSQRYEGARRAGPRRGPCFFFEAGGPADGVHAEPPAAQRAEDVRRTSVTEH